ncbi:hypothetical protein BDK51DRAFT_52328 [Blyttiomyces helicus]|uniref:Uncharacterized protein n=1 Tax=Blyttiomyces helicus TaxID=388810 RepID=A0A4P9WJK7_9FUNG|nr:hypothetical protein BDK51DRAFT_52328 [Blyttiomyces helicus]|eukprot:RKO90816.1 hypothetical protein BDK51DRAFT_52328 [Blyttiomyces helicus]
MTVPRRSRRRLAALAIASLFAAASAQNIIPARHSAFLAAGPLNLSPDRISEPPGCRTSKYSPPPMIAAPLPAPAPSFIGGAPSAGGHLSPHPIPVGPILYAPPSPATEYNPAALAAPVQGFAPPARRTVPDLIAPATISENNESHPSDDEELPPIYDGTAAAPKRNSTSLGGGLGGPRCIVGCARSRRGARMRLGAS